MSCRIVPCSFLAACLVFVGVALWLPGEAASRHQAEAEPEPSTPDARLIAGECAFVVTFRPNDFLGDELVKALLQNIPKAIEDELHVAPSNMARLTVATMRQGTVQVVRTKKPYDADKIRKARAARSGTTARAFDKDKAVREAPEPAAGEKKAGGKTIYYTGELQHWTMGWCPFDKTTFLTGNVAALQALLETKGKPSAGMTDALALGSGHSLVMGFDGKRLRTMFRQQREDRERGRREGMKKREERFKDFPKDSERDKDKDKLSRRDESSREVFVSARLQKEGGKAKDDDDVDAIFDSLGAGAILLPYKPLLSAKFGLLTLDIGKTHTMTAKIEFDDKADLDDGETALKSVLYVGRQLAGMLPKAARDFGGLRPLSAPVRKAFEDAKVERKDTTLNTTITLTPEAGLAKEVRDALDEEGKKRGKMFRGREKTTTTDKLAPGDKR